MLRALAAILRSLRSPQNAERSTPQNACWDSSHRVGKACKVEIPNPHRRGRRAAVGRTSLSDLVDAVEHLHDALIEAEVLHGADDLSLLDEERAIACDPGQHHRARIQDIRIEEVRAQHAALAAGNELVQRLRSFHHPHRAASATTTASSTPAPTTATGIRLH